MHDLGPQLRLAWGDVLVEAVEDALHHRPPAGIGDGATSGRSCGGLARFQQQLRPAAGWKKPRSARLSTRVHRAVIADARVGQIAGPPWRPGRRSKRRTKWPSG